MVSMYSLGEKEEIEWSKLKCTILSFRYASGYVIHHSKVLQLNNLTKDSKVKVRIEGSLIVQELDDNEHHGAEGNWEYIRQFMEQGPDDLNIVATPVVGLNHLDKQAMYSYNAQDSLKSNWFWPILKEKDRNKLAVYFTYTVLWPIKVVFFIPNLLSDWLWRKMCLRQLKDSQATPDFSMKASDKPYLTSNNAEQVITIEEASNHKDLSVSEIRKRLKTTMF